MPDTTDIINGVIHDVIFDIVVKAVMDRIILAVPFLAFPIINPIFGALLGWIAGIFYEELAKDVRFEIIAIQVGGQQKDYDQALLNLKSQLNLPGEKQDEKAIQKSLEDVKAKLASLIRLK